MIGILRRRGLGKVSCDLISQHSSTGLKVFRTDRRIPSSFSTVINWGVLSNAVSEITINTPGAIHRGADKAGFRKLLMENDLAPKTWFNAMVSFPCIIRPLQHSGGNNLYVCQDSSDLQEAIRKCGGQFYASKLIDKKAEFRVYAAQGRAIGVGEKHPANPEAVAWNMRQGGSCKNVRWDMWPLKVVKAGLAAHKLSGLDFSAIDIIVDREDNPYVLEVNSAPTLANYRAQGFAKVFDYMIQNGKTPLELSTRPGGYRKFGHPAVIANALV